MKKIGILLLSFLLMLSVGVAGATTIDFDDNPGEPIYYGYHGFDWDSDVEIGATNGYDGGYQLLDADGYVAYNYYGDDPSSIKLIGSGTFDFNSADWASAWDSSQTLTLYGYNDGVELYQTSVTITNSSILNLELNWTGIDQLTMYTSGSHYAMDNFTYNESAPVPEPTTMLLLGVGLLGLAGVNRKKIVFG